MERDMELLYKHTNEHIVDEIKKKNPQWITDDGYCTKCVDYYKKQMGKSTNFFGVNKATDASLVNISLGGVQKRTVMGSIILVATLVGLYFMIQYGLPKLYRLGLVIPFFMAMVCLVQAREQVCVILGAQGTQETDNKISDVRDEKLKTELKQASKKITNFSLLVAAALAALSLLF